MNVFDLRGPSFLLFYVCLMVGAVIVGRVLRLLVKSPADDLHAQVSFSPFEIAYLRGGASGAFYAAITALLHRRLIRVSNGRVSATSEVAHNLSGVEETILSAIRRNTGGKLSSIRSEVTREAPMRLEQYSLTMEMSQRVTGWLITLLITAVVVGAGITKISIGVDRHKPVGFLVVLTIVSAIVIPVLCRPGLRTRRGDKFLAVLKRQNASLQMSASRNPSILMPDEMAMAYGLFGAAALSTPEFNELRRNISQSGGDGGIVHSCGSSGCGGGSSCGGGGCGGGGCGGCGSS